MTNSPLSGVTIKTPTATRAYGSPAKAPVKSGTSAWLLRPLLGDVPVGASVTSADLVLTQVAAVAGSVQVSVQPISAAFTSRTTWQTAPAVTGAAVTLTKTSPAAGTEWRFALSTSLQSQVAAGLVLGWKVTTTSTTEVRFYSPSASVKKPRLEWTYSTTPATPTDLSPAGVVSLSKPTATFTPPAGMTAFKVETSTNASTVDWDSGWVASTAASLDLSAGSFPGGSHDFRVTARTAGGDSAASAWAHFTVTSRGTTTFSSPAASVTDGSPPLDATFSVGVTAFRAELRDALGNTLASSGLLPPPLQWVPDAGLIAAGDGEMHVWVTDSLGRVASPGDPVETHSVQAFTFTPSGAGAGITGLVVEQRRHVPWVRLRGTRAAGTPDRVRVWRDGSILADLTGPECFDGIYFDWQDFTAPMGTTLHYRVDVQASGTWSALSDVVSIKPDCLGIWFGNPESGASVVLFDAGVERTGGEVDVVHQPLRDRAPAVRRRLARLLRSGKVSGTVVDTIVDHPAAESVEGLRQMVDDDAGSLWRLVVGGLNLPVIVRADDGTGWPLEFGPSEIINAASVSWWEQ